VQVGGTATAFATIINSGTLPGTACSIALATAISGSLTYQTTSATTNQTTGSVNQPVNIAAGDSQSFVIAIKPTAPFGATDVAFTMGCSNSAAASSTTGLNTLLLSASSTPVPDIVALAATATKDGYVHLTSGSGAFAVASVNVGASGAVTATADTGAATLPVSLSLCQTNPATGQCVNPAAPASSANITISANQTPTFAVFANSTGAITANPANSRIFLRFKDSLGVTRGSTSVAVTTN
jgi:hypothetical protein